MNSYLVQLRLHSPLGTPLVADTLFGHICWGIVYAEGEAHLGRFLEEVEAAHALVISDPLPSGFWPMPALPGPVGSEFQNLLAFWKDLDLIAAHDRIKAILRRRWMSHRAWTAVASGCTVSEIVKRLHGDDHPPELRAGSLLHNVINRITGRPRDEGGLFTDELWYPPADMVYDVWVRSTWDAARIQSLFEWGLAGGYGRDASTGKGGIDVLSVKPATLPSAAGANAVMTIGSCVPAETDLTDGFWKIDVRHGKLGGPWASHDDQGESTPFKHPVIFLERGAVFRSDNAPAVLGRVVHHVHPSRSEVVTSGLTLTLPLVLNEEVIPC